MIDVTDPWAALAAWMTDAAAHEPRVPDAMQVATVGPDGRPSIRTVLLKSHAPDGLVFYTNLGSRKATELASNASAAVLLHWKTLERQVIAEGTVRLVSDAEADAYWASRDRGSQVGAWASRQSHPVASREQLQARVAESADRFEGAPVPRPAFWSGYRLIPERFEFWQGRPDRLHDRMVVARQGGEWVQTRLNP